MAISSDYRSIEAYTRLQEKLRWSFGFAFHENKEFEEAPGVNTVGDWYKDVQEFRDKKTEGDDNRHAILSVISNNIINELVKHVEPCYKDSIIKDVGITSSFKESCIEMNCNIAFISIKPFVKFVKQVNGHDVSSANFRFQLDTSLYVNKLQIHSNPQGKSLDIDKLGVELELTLLQVIISSFRMPVPVISLNEPIKLITKKFEVNDISFHL